MVSTNIRLNYTNYTRDKTVQYTLFPLLQLDDKACTSP